MTEKRSYAMLREKIFANSLDRVDRIENELVTGMFDVNYCIDGTEGWIEIKSPEEPKRQTTKLFGSNHKLSQDQKNWCLRELQAGGLAWVLISTEQRWLLIHGSHADNIHDLTISELIEIARWHKMKPVKGNEPWKELRQVLASR